MLQIWFPDLVRSCYVYVCSCSGKFYMVVITVFLIRNFICSCYVLGVIPDRIFICSCLLHFHVNILFLLQMWFIQFLTWILFIRLLFWIKSYNGNHRTAFFKAITSLKILLFGKFTPYIHTYIFITGLFMELLKKYVCSTYQFLPPTPLRLLGFCIWKDTYFYRGCSLNQLTLPLRENILFEWSLLLNSLIFPNNFRNISLMF